MRQDAKKYLRLDGSFVDGNSNVTDFVNLCDLRRFKKAEYNDERVLYAPMTFRYDNLHLCQLSLKEWAFCAISWLIIILYIHERRGLATNFTQQIPGL